MELDHIFNSYETFPGSIGEYVPGQCQQCTASGRFHEVMVCQVCGWPPAGDSKCACDWDHGPRRVNDGKG